ncbi:MAG: hypothetical protein IT450_01865 [Phycisphaerales bacterium]|nr:hypothetical protein [Phycisphaerales bacterium]
MYYAAEGNAADLSHLARLAAPSSSTFAAESERPNPGIPTAEEMSHLEFPRRCGRTIASEKPGFLESVAAVDFEENTRPCHVHIGDEVDPDSLVVANGAWIRTFEIRETVKLGLAKEERDGGDEVGGRDDAYGGDRDRHESPSANRRPFGRLVRRSTSTTIERGGEKPEPTKPRSVEDEAGKEVEYEDVGEQRRRKVAEDQATRDDGRGIECPSGVPIRAAP